MKSWYYASAEQTLGPLPEEQIHALLARGELDDSTMLWTEGMPEWRTTAEIVQFRQGPSRPHIAFDALAAQIDSRSVSNTLPSLPGPPLAAPAPTKPDRGVQAFRLGRVFGRSWAVLLTRVGIWFLVGLIETLVILFFLPGSDLTAMIVKLLTGAQVQGMIAYAAFQAWRTLDSGSGPNLQRWWKRVLSLLGIVALIIVGPTLSVFVMAMLGLLLRAAESDSVLILGGAAAVFLPLAAIFGFMMFAHTPASSSEKPLPAGARKTGCELNSGSFWKSFLLLAAILFPYVIFATVAGAAVMLETMSGTSSMASLMEWTVLLTTSPLMLIYLPCQWVATAFAGILAISACLELRRGSSVAGTNVILRSHR